MKREVKKGKRDKLEEEGRKMFGKEVNEVKKVNSRMLCSMKNERGELLTKKKKKDTERWREHLKGLLNAGI